MTLDICKLLFNVLNKQMKIQHNEKSAGVYKVEEIPQNIKDKIASRYGEDYLGDANLLIFFKGEEDKKSIKKLFKTVDNAFGNDANLLVVGDFKKLSLNDDSSSSDEEADEPETEEDIEAADAGTKSEQTDDEKEIQGDIDEVLNEDDDTEEVEDDDSEEETEEDAEEDSSEDDSDSSEEADKPTEEVNPETPGEYVFLKITLKN